MTIKKDELNNRFIEVLEKHKGIIFKISRAYAYTFHNREDLINDIILQLWKSFETFKGQSKISTWIYRVSLNTSMSYHLKNQKDILTFTEAIVEIDLKDIISTNYTELEEYTILYQCIDELEEFNKAIVLLYLDGNSHEEISLITGISITNVGTRIGRIKEQLKKSAFRKI